MLIISFAFKSYSQNSCLSANVLNCNLKDSLISFQLQNDSMPKWFKFTASDEELIFGFYAAYSQNDSIPIDFDSIAVYTGNCQNLAYVQTFTDNSFTLNLIENNDYFILIYPKINNPEFFNIAILMQNIILLNCPPICNDLVINGDFETTTFVPYPLGTNPNNNMVYTSTYFSTSYNQYTITGFNGLPPFLPSVQVGLTSDVTTGSGNFLYLDAPQYAGTSTAWQQNNIPVVFGKTYQFSFFVKQFQFPEFIFPGATIRPYINNQQAGPHHIVNHPNWIELCYTWTPPSPSVQNISLRIDITGGQSGLGYDMGIDNIRFGLISFDFTIFGPDKVCENEEFDLTVTNLTGQPPYSYLWSAGNPNTNSSITILAQTTNTYTVTVTDGNGCQVVASHTVNVISGPQSPQINGANFTCENNDTWAITNYNQNFTYNWSVWVGGSQVYSIPNGGQTFVFDWSPYYDIGGVIEVNVTDPASGCTATSYLPVKDCCRDDADFVWEDDQTYTMNGSFSGKDIVIKGEPNLQGNFTFQNCHFYFEEYASLILLDGIMNFDVCLFTECTDTAWNRIYLKNINGKVTFTEDTIQYSLNGIDNSHCRELQVAGSKFFNNFEKSIFVSGCVSFPYYNFVDIYGNTIETTVGGCVFPNTGKRAKTGIKTTDNIVPTKLYISNNTFNRLGNGIYSTNSNLKLIANYFFYIGTQMNPAQYQDAAFRAVNPLPPPTTYNIEITEGNSFNNSEEYGGIYITGNHNLEIHHNNFNNIYRGFGIKYNNVRNGVVNITNNYFANNSVGVHAIYNKGITFGHASNISNNEFYTPSAIGSATGILIDELPIKNDITYIVLDNIIHLNNPNVARGIKFTNANGALVRENNIIVKNTSSTVSKNVGIESIGSHFATIYQNTITGVNFSSGSTSFGIKLQNSTSNTVQCNDIKNIGYGISAHNVCSNSTIWDNKLENQNYGLTLFDDGHIGPQGSLDRHSNNKWKNVTLHTYTFYSQGVNSKLYVKNVPPSNGWYINPIIWTNHYIPQTYPYSPFAKDSTAGGVFVVCPIEFISDPKTASLGEMEALINEDIEFVEFPDVSTEFGKWQVVENVFQDTALLSSAAIQMYVDNMENIAHGKILDVREKITEDELILARQINNSIYPASYFEEASKLYNEIMIDYAENEFQLTDDQKQILFDLAYQCPYVYGEAVYGARALMSQYDNDLIYYLNICEIDFSQRSVEDHTTEKQNTDASLKFYPNPTNNLLTFEIIDIISPEKYTLIEIFNVEGMKLFSKTFSDQSICTIDVSFLNNGVYSCHIQNGTNNFKDSFIIVK